MSVPEQRAVLLQQHAAVQLYRDHLRVALGKGDEAVTSEIPITIARRGSEVKLVHAAGDTSNRGPDPVLLKLVVLARTAQQSQFTAKDEPLVSHYSRAHLQQLLRISWLAPDILSAIVAGRQPVTLTGRRLLRATNIPHTWDAQREFFGFF